MTELINQILHLENEIKEHENQINHHSFYLKIKQAKIKKLRKQFSKITEILNEQLPQPISES